MTDQQAVKTFELPNVGPGPDPCSLADLVAENEFLVVYLQRDHYCTNCRDQVQTLATRYDAFRERGAEVVSIVPEPRERVAGWQDSYDLPFPLLADPDATTCEGLDQPVRFGFLGDLSDFLGRMPRVVAIDARDGESTVGWSHSGSSTFDRPDVDKVLAELDRLRA